MATRRWLQLWCIGQMMGSSQGLFRHLIPCSGACEGVLGKLLTFVVMNDECPFAACAAKRLGNKAKVAAQIAKADGMEKQVPLPSVLLVAGASYMTPRAP